MTSRSGRVLKIGACTVDPGLDEISREGNNFKLEPRAMRVLIYLAEYPGEVVSVEKLLDHVWTDLVVTPDSVYTAIAALRRALGDDSREPCYIANVPRRGYRLVAAVRPWQEHGDADGGPAPTNTSADPAVIAKPLDAETTSPRTSRYALWRIVTASLAIVTVALLAWHRFAPRSGTEVNPAAEKSIAVIPFTDVSEKGDQQYLASGLAEEIYNLLVEYPHLKVMRRASAQIVRHDEDPRAIGKALGVSYIVSGSIARIGGRIRVTAQLTDANSGSDFWIERYDRDFDELLALQDQIATRVARALQVAIGASESGVVHRPTNAAAYILYLRGLYLYDFQHAEALAESQGYLEQSLAADPSSIRTAETLALVHVAQATGETVVPREAFERARSVAQMAIHLDPHSSTAHAVLGLVLAEHDFNWAAAENEFTVALSANPRNAAALDFAARVAHERGANDEAMRRIGASLALDALNPYALQTLGQIQFAKGELDAAEKTFRTLANASPTWDDNHGYLAAIALARGDRDTALREAKLEVSVDAQAVALVLVYQASGQRAKATETLTHIEPYSRDIWPTGIAIAFANLGDLDRAFAWLDRAKEQRDPEMLMEIRSDYLVGPLRADPRYRRLLGNLNLSE